MYKKLSFAAGIILLVGGLSYIAFYRSQVNQLIAMDSQGGSDSGSSGGTFVSTNGESLPVRSGPGEEYDVIDSLSDGTPVTVVATSGGWSEISGGGWVASEWLSFGDSGGSEDFGCAVLKKPDLSRRVLAEQETTVLSLTIKPNQGCSVSLQAPNFIVSPESSEYSFEASDNRIGKEISIGWVLSPQKSGRFDISVSDGFSIETLHLRVTDVFGFSPWQTQIAAQIVAFIGGGMTLEKVLSFFKGLKNTNQDKESTGSDSSE